MDFRHNVYLIKDNGKLLCSNCESNLAWMWDEVTVFKCCPYCGKKADFADPIPIEQISDEDYEDLYRGY